MFELNENQIKCKQMSFKGMTSSQNLINFAKIKTKSQLIDFKNKQIVKQLN